jgi:hypothetical protein
MVRMAELEGMDRKVFVTRLQQLKLVHINACCNRLVVAGTERECVNESNWFRGWVVWHPIGLHWHASSHLQNWIEFVPDRNHACLEMIFWGNCYKSEIKVVNCLELSTGRGCYCTPNWSTEECVCTMTVILDSMPRGRKIFDLDRSCLPRRISEIV